MSACISKRSQKYRVKADCNQAEPYFPFLLLPGELRNYVYEFALTHPNGIKLRWQTFKDPLTKKPVMVVNGESESDVEAINQLQYVSRQLRKETAGLEIQYNNVAMDTYPKHPKHPKPKVSPIRSLFMFSISCTPSRLSWLTNVSLINLAEPIPDGVERPNTLRWISDHTKSLVGLLKFCAAHRHIRVDIHLPWFASRHDDDQCNQAQYFIMVGTALTRLFRGQNISYIEDGQDYIGQIDLWMSMKLGHRTSTIEHLGLEAPNLVLRTVDRYFDEDTFRAHANNAFPDFVDSYEWLADGGVDLWVEYARRWVGTGI